MLSAHLPRVYYVIDLHPDPRVLKAKNLTNICVASPPPPSLY